MPIIWILTRQNSIIMFFRKIYLNISRKLNIYLRNFDKKQIRDYLFFYVPENIFSHNKYYYIIFFYMFTSQLNVLTIVSFNAVRNY